jgi:DNA polymerase-3 subunit gamma/tau
MRLASIESVKKKKSLIKTTEVENLSKDQNHQVDIIEVETNKKLFPSPTSKDVSSLSLASLTFTKSTEDQNEHKQEDLPSDSFTENDFLVVWRKFCNLEKNKGNNNILSLLSMNDPVIIDNTIVISTINKMNFKEVKEYKNTIQTYISKELNNYSITVEVKLSEEITSKSYIDSKEKLEIIIENNEDIGKLIAEFKLRI